MIVVVGSLNFDTTATVPRLPGPGETVLGFGHYTDTGGKGANQAVAAARLGGQVAMVGRWGDDAAGESLLRVLDSEGVDRSGVVVDGEVLTGAAFITVDGKGENMIVVSPGANARVAEADLAAVDWTQTDVVLSQLEVPIEAVAAAASRGSGPFILNPAPAAQLSSELLGQVDILVPNRSELGLLAGVPEPGSLDEVRAAIAELGLDTVVVTLGAEGALVHHEGRSDHVPAPSVEPVDPTAAGDAFCGALAVMTAEGRPLTTAVELAVQAGALAATRPGAQSSLPYRSELEFS